MYPIAITLIILLILSVCGLFRLVLRYGATWKFRDLKLFDKFIFVFLWIFIGIWVAFILMAIFTFPIIK